MARIYTEGFELGDALFWDTVSGSVGQTIKRSGNFAFTPSGSNTKNMTSLSEFYYRIGYYASSYDTTTSRIQWRNSTTVLGVLRMSGQKVAAYTGAAATLVGTGSITLVDGVFYLIEIYIKIADSGGRIVVKVDGVIDIDFTGDTKPSTQSTCDNILVSNVGGAVVAVDDIALNDTTGSLNNSWCGDGHIIALFPNGNGDVTGLTGSDGNSTDNYLLIDEAPASASDYVQGSTADLYDLYNLAGTGWSSGVAINGVYVEARALDTVAAGGLCQLGVKPLGYSEAWSSSIALLTSTTAIKGTWMPGLMENDVFSRAWTLSDIENMQIGFKVK